MIDKIKSIGRSIFQPIDADKARERLKVCEVCRYAHEMTVPPFNPVTTCGPPIMGGKIKWKGKRVTLCGCVMDQKVKDPEAICPVGRW